MTVVPEYKINLFIIGLDRCAEQCAKSLHQKLSSALAGIEVQYHIYLWLPENGFIVSSRSGEHQQREFSPLWEQLFEVRPTLVYQSPVIEELRQKDYYESLIAAGDIYEDQFQTVANYMGYLEELSVAASTYHQHVDAQLPALLIRSDLMAVKIDADSVRRLLRSLGPNEVATPRWGSFSYCNDRVLFGKTQTVLRLMERERFLGEYLSEKGVPFHSEAFFAYSVRRLGIKHRSLSCAAFFARVRSSGNVVREDFNASGWLYWMYWRCIFSYKYFKLRMKKISIKNSV